MIDITPVPNVFSVGPLAIHSYGIAYAMGLAGAYVVTSREARARGLDARLLSSAMIVVAVAAPACSAETVLIETDCGRPVVLDDVARDSLLFAAIAVANAGPIQIAIPRPLELVAVLLVGFVAGAWVDRVCRRPIMVAADLGRAILLGSIPVAAVAGVLGLGQLFVVAFLAAFMSMFFDSADRAFLPTIVERDELAAEFTAFGIAGALIQILTAPIAIAAAAQSFVASGALIRSIQRPEFQTG